MLNEFPEKTQNCQNGESLSGFKRYTEPNDDNTSVKSTHANNHNATSPSKTPHGGHPSSTSCKSISQSAKISENFLLSKKKAVFENRSSLSPPVSCNNSSSFFPSLLKINENHLFQTTSCASSTHISSPIQSSHSKSSISDISRLADSDHDSNVTPVAQVNTRESPTFCCLEDLPKHDKNSGALTELATGSLATCSSILEVGKEDQQKQKSHNSLSAAKLRFYIASDKVPKHLFENRKLSRHSNGLENDRCSNSLDISRPFLQSFKTINARSFSNKTPTSDFSKAPNKGEKYGMKSDFSQVYSCEQFLDKGGPSESYRPAARKSVIELKSKSLDPPFFESDFKQGGTTLEEIPSKIQQNSTWSSLFPARLPSRSLSQHHSDIHPTITKRRDSETAVFSMADNQWLQKLSDKQEPPADNSNSSASQKSLNIQKLKSFFGETTPKIIEAKKMNSVITKAKDDLCIKPTSFDFQRHTEYASCKYTSSSGGLRRKKNCHVSSKQVSKKSSKDSSGSPQRLNKEHKTWRGKMAQTLKRYGSGATPPSEQYTGALGVPLEHCMSSFANQYVPLIVETCTRIVEERGLYNVGVYRVPGNSGAVNLLIELLNKDPYGLCLENERWQDVNLMSSLLKLFFRRLPDSLITEELYDAFIAANRLENPERRMLKIKKLIHELPEHNFETFSFLAQHLNRVASHEEVNKMDGHNLAIVFGPTLVRPLEDGMVLMVKDMQDQVKVIETVITHCDWLFSSWDEDVYVPIDGDDDDIGPVSGVNHVLLERAEKLDNRSSLSF